MGFGMDEEWDFDPLEDLYHREDYEIWRAKDGTDYEVAEMESSHINNIIRMIKQERFRADWLQAHGEDWLDVFENELRNRK
jgi:hypothetical protein